MSCNLFSASKKRGIQGLQKSTIKPTTHVVRKGQTLSTIADMYGTDYQSIAKANGISNPNNIYIGQRLNIPDAKQTPIPPKKLQPKPPSTKKPVPDDMKIDSKGSGCGCRIDIDGFFQNCKYTGQQKESIRKILMSIQEYYTERNQKCDLRKIAYMLATTKHETAGTFKPISEYGSKIYFNRYDPVLASSKKRREVAKRMGNTEQGDGYKYRGRGFVQLTWKNNYKKVGDYLGIDLVGHPQLALDYNNATKIMIYGMEKGIFTGKKLSNYISKNKADYYNARRIINGHDKASTIEKYAKKFEKCLKYKK